MVLDKHHIHIVDARLSRPDVQVVAQPLHMLGRPGRLATHRAVRLIAHPSTQLQVMRLLQRALAEEHTLHEARHWSLVATATRTAKVQVRGHDDTTRAARAPTSLVLTQRITLAPRPCRRPGGR